MSFFMRTDLNKINLTEEKLEQKWFDKIDASVYRNIQIW